MEKLCCCCCLSSHLETNFRTFGTAQHIHVCIQATVGKCTSQLAKGEKNDNINHIATCNRHLDMWRMPGLGFKSHYFFMLLLAEMLTYFLKRKIIFWHDRDGFLRIKEYLPGISIIWMCVCVCVLWVLLSSCRMVESVCMFHKFPMCILLVFDMGSLSQWSEGK